MSKALGLLLVGAMILGSVGTAAAQTAGGEKSEKKVYYGPSKSAFGKLELVLEQGASSEVEYQPDASRVAIKTLVGEARIISAASYLILVENLDGKVDIKLPNGRIISVEPGKSEIVGRAIADDPGQIVIRMSGTGPIAAAGGDPLPGGPFTSAVITVLELGPAAVLGIVVLPPQATGPNRPETFGQVSPFTPGLQGFGSTP